MKDIKGRTISKIWLAEFRGFFFGDGYLGVVANGKNRKGKVYYSCRAQITIRDDDIKMLKDIKSKLGGLLHTEQRGKISKKDGKVSISRPYSVWRATGKKEVSVVCDILDMSVMPSKKIKEVIEMRKYLNTIGAVGHGPLNNKKKIASYKRTLEKRDKIALELKRLHSYNK